VFALANFNVLDDFIFDEALNLVLLLFDFYVCVLSLFDMVLDML